MGTVCVCRDTGGRGRGMKKIKVREYGWWTSYAYKK
jgi:hypothetical protein